MHQIKLICKVSKETVYIQLIREFDPGSGLTLAAHIRHASRTEVVITQNKDLSEGRDYNNGFSGGLVSNT